MDPVLSVIIVSWNTRELLRKCLRSLERVRAMENAQVMVVDNASSDGSGRMVRTEFPWVDLIASERNLGFAAANNRALGFVRGRYVLFLNPDTEVREGVIDALVRYLDDHPEAGAVGTTLLNPDGTLQLYCNRYYTFWHSLKHNRIVARLTQQHGMACTQRLGQPRNVEWMLGACLAVRTRALEEVGAFDPRFFVYGEEMDLQYRIKKAGWGIVYVPSPGVVHYSRQSTRQAGLAGSLHEYRGRWLFARKHYRRPATVALLTKTISGLVAGMVYWAAMAAIRCRPEAGLHLRTYWQLFAWHLAGCPAPSAPRLVPVPKSRES